MASNSSKAYSINAKKDEIKKMLVEIGDRIHEKHIEINDKNVKAEIECIEELLAKKQ